MFSKNYKLLCLFSLSTLLVACGSTPQQVKREIPQQIATEITVDSKYDGQYYLRNGQRAYQRSGDIRVRNQWVLKAAEAFALQQECPKALKVVMLAMPELNDVVQLTHARVLLAECLLQQAQLNQDELMRLVDGMHYQTGFDNRINRLKASLYASQQDWLAAARATLRSSSDGQLDSQTIWELLQNLAAHELPAAMHTYPDLSVWLELSQLIHRFGFEQQQLNLAINQWQNRHGSHPLVTNLPPEVTAARTLPVQSYAKVAVLLPLSGRLANQGQAIKDGMMAGYFDAAQNQLNSDTQQTLTFFDTNRIEADALVEQTVEYDFIIGPLLKDNIRNIASKLSENKPFLALNRIDESGMQGQSARYFFALAPEDEALQLVAKVKASGATKPILVADNNSTTRRMADTFIQAWMADQPSGTDSPGLALFTNSKSMREGVTGLLDVAQSNQRIKQIENLVSKELHAVPRNRRDIDAIVLFANPEQTELLNPIIESSLSPFNDKQVPVFATSRSYSLELNNNSLRDLRNLTFTDMPWMLPAHSWTSLESQLTSLWPDRKDSLRRLFAMGYDSYTMLPKLQYLETLPQLRLSGLTGELSLDEQNRIRRILPFGQVIEDKVQLVALD